MKTMLLDKSILHAEQTPGIVTPELTSKYCQTRINCSTN